MKVKDTNYGPLWELECKDCGNKKYWDLHKITNADSTLGIKHGKTEEKYGMYCPVCNNGVSIDKDKFEQFLPIAEVNQQYLKRKITKEEHQKRLEELDKSISKA
jgi:hypothetical protein